MRNPQIARVFFSAVTVFAFAAAVPAARADTLNVWQCASCTGGVGGVGGSSALNSTGALNIGAGNSFTTQIVTGATWTPTTAGVYNFNDTTSATLGGFLSSGSGTATPSSLMTSTTVITTANLGVQTEFVFSFAEGVASSISITHDDGIALFLNGVLQTPTNMTLAKAADPTESELTTYALLGPGTITLGYVTSNGVPEILDMTVTPVPLPATAWLFGAGLGGLLLLKRRRNNGLRLAA